VYFLKSGCDANTFDALAGRDKAGFILASCVSAEFVCVAAGANSGLPLIVRAAFILAAKSLYQVWRRRICYSAVDAKYFNPRAARIPQTQISRRPRDKGWHRLPLSSSARQLAAGFRRKSHFIAFSARPAFLRASEQKLISAPAFGW
jgi:hypothetical protein